MSDTAAPLTTTTESAAPASAPQSTEQIAATVNEQLNAEDSQPETSARVDTTDLAAQPEKVVEKPPTAAEISAAAKFLSEQGHQMKKVDGRDTWLPIKTVEGMLERYVEKHRGTWTGERSTLESQAKELREHINSLRTAVAGDPKAFLSEIAELDPRYKSFLEPQAARHEAPAAADAKMPGPDLTLSDGSKTYSLEGLQALLEWNTARVEGRLDERLKPYAEREKAERERAQLTEFQQKAHERFQSQMSEAQTWAGFGTLNPDGSLTEVQAAVLKRLQDDTAKAKAAGQRPTMTLREAYLEVHAEKLAADDTTKRAQWMKEMNQAPRSTSVTGSRGEVTRPSGQRTTEEITRETLERLGA